jgi:CRISPR-associated protein (TIGR03986 family)
MKTGTLKLLGKIWQLSLENGKIMTIPSYYTIPQELDGATVQYDNTGGKINTIKHEGVELPKRELIPITPKKGHDQSNERGNRDVFHWNNDDTNYATAPYNFIPLPQKIVPAPESEFDFSSYQKELLNGYIDLSIEALTDLFIRGEMEKFFSIAGKPAIPGSSLRGLVRSMVELVSFSKLSFTERNRRYFYRNIGDEYYKKQFISNRNREPIKLKSKPGYLVKIGRSYKLYPVDKVYRIDMLRLHNNFATKGLTNNNRCHSQVDVWYDSDTVLEVREKNGFLLEYNLLRELFLSNSGALSKGVLLRTGEFGRKKHYQWVFPEFLNKPESIDVTTIMDSYETDDNKDPSADLIKLSNYGNPVPCFYLSDEYGKPKFIGHTGIFRIPYQKTIGDCIPNQIDAGIDIANTIFGIIDQNGKSQRSGKVYFEDCGYTCQEEPSMKFSPLKILSSPKPTSYQLYLEERNGRAVNWDGDKATIRGQKMYWHRVGVKWANNDPTLTNESREQLVGNALVTKNTQYTVAEVVLKGATFSGRLRFENLHPVELGALLAALKLPSECAHKIGMGKPYGMGSIRIEPKVFLIDRLKRYSKMFTHPVDGANQLAEDATPANVDQFLGEFLSHLVKHNVSGDPSKGWHQFLKNNERLKELYTMLLLHPSFGGPEWLKKTDYMDLSMFKNRGILKKPTEYL